jgi:hypothetical protein
MKNPLQTPYVFINGEISVDELALFLPWTHAKQRAKIIIDNRREEGYRSFDEIMLLAESCDGTKLEATDEDRALFQIFPRKKETVK